MSVVSRIVGSVASFAVVAAFVLVAPLAATAASSETDPGDGAVEVMGDYNPSDYVDQAAALPEDLVVAIDRDLGLSPEEYLAGSDAAVQASTVVDSLTGAGVDVLGSSIDGTALTVNVASEADAAIVESTGAQVALGAPEKWVAPDLPITAAEDIYGGQGYSWSGILCSIGFNGFLTSTGARQLVTAGHCTAGMGSSDAIRVVRSVTANNHSGLGSTIGTVVAGSTAQGSGADVGRVSSGGSGIVAKPSVLTWGGAAGAPLASTPQNVTRMSAAVVGANICKSGATSGWRCGLIVDVDYPALVDASFTVNSIVAQICVLPGDSGGAAMIGSAAVGVTSWRQASDDETTPSCATTEYGGFFPTTSSGGASVQSVYGSTWEPSVVVATPAASFAGTGALTTTLSGTLATASAPSTVAVYIDGSSTPITASAASGSWSVPISAVGSGLHSFRVEGRYGAWSKGASLTGWFSKGVAIDRISGADRFAVGIAISNKLFPSPASVPVVYITTGFNYPDALSAAPAAAIQGGPLLLTSPGGLPATIKAEIIRLNPAKIVVVGGVNSVSSTVFSQLSAIQSNIVRLGGADRYEASRNIVRSAFGGSGASTAYIATGANFPDALSASGAGGAFAAPVILVNGTATTLDAATRTLLTDLGVTQIKIAGGPNSVSPGIASALAGIAPTTRMTGADRFEASSNIALDAFTSSHPTQVYIATGLNYPDALSGAALAGIKDAPLIVVPTDCVPAATLTAFRTLGVTKVTLLGGPVSLTANVMALKSC